MKSLLVLGLDGATYDVLDPYVHSHPRGALAQMRDTGTVCRLASTMPYFTGPAWTTFMTGLGPEQHGVYHWRARVDPTTGQRPLVSTRHLEQASYWSHAQQHGATVSITNFPMAYPAPPTEGVFVCGTLALEDAPSRTWPPQLAERIGEAIPNYRFEIELGRSATDEPARLRDHILDVGRNHLRAALQFGRLDRADLAVHVVTVTDRMQHFFWDSPHDEVLAAYELADAALEQLLALRHWDTVLVLSDHGAGSSQQVFQTDEWLIARGWAQRGPDGALDPTSSWAYAGEEPEVAIYVNQFERDGFGVPLDAFAGFVEGLRTELLGLRIPGGNVPVFRDVVLASERPAGEYRDLGPDVLLLPTSGVHPRPGPAAELFTEPGPLISGHRPEGILMLSGGGFTGLNHPGGPGWDDEPVQMAELFSLMCAIQELPVPGGVPLCPLLSRAGVPYTRDLSVAWPAQVDGPPPIQDDTPAMLHRLQELGYL